MPEQLTDEAIRMLNAQGATWMAEQQAAADAMTAAAAAETAAAAERARLQPHDDAIQAAARTLDADLAAARSTDAWKTAQAAVRAAHAVLAEIKRAGPDRDKAQAEYDAAIVTRDALTAQAFADHDAMVAKHVSARDAEVSAIAAEKGGL